MKINRLIQSILLTLAIVGVFAAMARNAYGFTFMGVAGVGLSLVYFVQMIWRLINEFSMLDRKNVSEMLELLLLAVLVLLLGFRASYIYLPGAEIIFMVTCLLLLATYAVAGLDLITAVRKENSRLAWNVGYFYAAVLLFLLAFAARKLNLVFMIAGGLGVLASIPFLLAIFRQQKYDLEGRSFSLFRFVADSKNKAGLLFVFFLASGLYVTLSSLRIIPAIENADRPRTYIELIDDAESGREKPLNGKFRHETYKDAMDRFNARHAAVN